MQNIQTLLFILLRHVIDHIGRRGARTSGEDKAVAHIEIDVGDKLHRLFEIVCGFAGEADNKVRAYLNIRARLTQLANNRFVLQCGMGASHQIQNPVRTALHRQVQEAHQLRRIAIDLDDIVGKFDRVAGGEANTVDAVDGGDQTQQIGKAAGGAVVILTAPGVNVLAQQINLTHALRRQLGDFKQDIVARTADLFSAGVRHHAVGTVFVAAFHNRNKGGRAVGARLWQAIELFNFREADIHHRAAVAAHGVNHLRQAVQGLRPENNIDIVCALTNMVAFLGGHAAANANNQVRVLLFQQLPASKLMENFFLGLLTN